MKLMHSALLLFPHVHRHLICLCNSILLSQFAAMLLVSLTIPDQWSIPIIIKLYIFQVFIFPVALYIVLIKLVFSIYISLAGATFCTDPSMKSNYVTIQNFCTQWWALTWLIREDGIWLALCLESVIKAQGYDSASKFKRKDT